MFENYPRDISVDDARERILAACSVLADETISIDDALGRVLAAEVIAPVDSPSFTNSAMDGYAVRAADIVDASDAPVLLPIAAEIQAGSGVGVRLFPGTCARIMTGAFVPVGADTVVPFELTSRAGDGRVSICAPLPVGANVRRAGEDVGAGDRLLGPGTRIGPADIGLLASVGLKDISVRRRARVAVLSTGDEVISPGAPQSTGHIWNANTPMLSAMILGLRAEPIDLGIAPDNGDVLVARLAEAHHRKADLLVTTGGVSAGDFDLVKHVMRARGGFEEWRVKMRPGRPLAFGAIDSLPVIGLPGNPVAAFVAFVQFVRPAILKMMGVGPSDWLPPQLPVIVREAIENRGGRRAFARVVVTRGDEGFEARLAGGQGSANLFSLARANGLLVIPETIERAEPGMLLNAQTLGFVDARQAN